jgi:hypothetical protein
MLDFQNVLSRWRELGRVNPERLRDARLNLHWAIQIVSAVGATHLPPLHDDSHTSLEWLATNGVLAGRLVDWPRPFRAALRPYDLMLQLRDSNLEVIVEHSLQQLSYESSIQWLSEQLNGLADQPPTIPLSRAKYELPAHELARGGAFSADVFLLKELSLWFSNADMVLRSLAIQLDKVSPVRCWPHHFDIGVVIDFGDGKSIGVGMEPGDIYYDQPYWYITPYPTPYPKPDQATLPPLSGGGIWHEHDWLGAVLRGNALTQTSPGDKQCAQVGEFLESAISASKQMIGVDLA